MASELPMGHVHTQRDVWQGEDEKDLHSQRQEDVEGGDQDSPDNTHIWESWPWWSN